MSVGIKMAIEDNETGFPLEMAQNTRRDVRRSKMAIDAMSANNRLAEKFNGSCETRCSPSCV